MEQSLQLEGRNPEYLTGSKWSPAPSDAMISELKSEADTSAIELGRWANTVPV
jgi:hypothetical protein